MELRCQQVTIERWPLKVPFRIARGAKTEASVVTVMLACGDYLGRGECCPYPRYGETADAIEQDLLAFDWQALVASAGSTAPADLRQALLSRLRAGSARNAIDCALWDLEAKITGRPVWELAKLMPPEPVLTCFTLSLDEPEIMAQQARKHTDCPLLKLKLGGGTDDAERMHAVRLARPDARLVADANEGWAVDELATLMAAAANAKLELVEQPLPAHDDRILGTVHGHVPLCADESAAPGTDAASVVDRYQAINIKLDKTGGLTAAIELAAKARSLGLKIMIGSMVSTSLSMAPAAMLSRCADWIDLDSPLLLETDRPDAMTIRDGYLSVPSRQLWG